MKGRKNNQLLQAILDLVNSGKKVTFEQDWGGNSMTISIDKCHTHVGYPSGDFETLVGNTIDALTNGPGLSFVLLEEGDEEKK